MQSNNLINHNETTYTRKQTDDGTMARCMAGGGSGGGGQAQETPSPISSELHGVWESNCIQATQTSSVRSRWEVERDKATYRLLEYKDGSCTALTRTTTDTYAGLSDAGAGGDFKVDLTRADARVKYVDLLFVLAARLGSEWGYTDWPLWTERRVTDRQKGPGLVPQYPLNQRRYDLFRLVGDRLYTGDSSEAEDRRTPDKRPKDAYMFIPYTKRAAGNTPPVAGVQPVLSLRIGGTLNNYPVISDADGDELTVSCEGPCPPGLTVANNLYSYSPTTPGARTANMVVRDERGAETRYVLSLEAKKEFLVYRDLDGDGYGSGALQTIEAAQETLPNGYSANNSDCADTDPSKWQLLTYQFDNNAFNGNLSRGGGSICSGTNTPENLTHIASPPSFKSSLKNPIITVDFTTIDWESNSTATHFNVIITDQLNCLQPIFFYEEIQKNSLVLSVENLNDGEYYLCIVAFDKDNNYRYASDAGYSKLTIDRTPPGSFDLLSYPRFTNSRSLRINWDSSDEAYSYEFKLVKGSTCEDIQYRYYSTKNTYVDLQEIDEGEYSICILSKDISGNYRQSNGYGQKKITFDFTPPGSFQITHPIKPTIGKYLTTKWSNSNGASFYKAFVSDSETCSTKYQEQIIDSSNNKASFEVNEIQSQYFFCVISYDAAGNEQKSLNSGYAIEREQIRSLWHVSNSGSIISTNNNGLIVSSNDFYVSVINSSTGGVIRKFQIESQGLYPPFGIAIDKENYIYILMMGKDLISSQSGGDLVVYKYDSIGNKVAGWPIALGSSENDYPFPNGFFLSKLNNFLYIFAGFSDYNQIISIDLVSNTVRTVPIGYKLYVLDYDIGEDGSIYYLQIPNPRTYGNNYFMISKFENGVSTKLIKTFLDGISSVTEKLFVTRNNLFLGTRKYNECGITKYDLGGMYLNKYKVTDNCMIFKDVIAVSDSELIISYDDVVENRSIDNPSLVNWSVNYENAKEIFKTEGGFMVKDYSLERFVEAPPPD